ncbi:11236_t:CDS:2 [Entrophospora sp. SA101]|nr:11236_t:CDS:2 [Entrophospora sp. SA101]
MKSNNNNTLPNYKLDTTNIPSEGFRSSPSTPVSTSIPLKKKSNNSKTSNSKQSQDYPLGNIPTPPALKRFCFDLNGQPAYIREHEDAEQQVLKALHNMRASGPTTTTSETATYHSFDDDNLTGAKHSESGAPTFDSLPHSMKSYMLFQLLRRCPTNTLQYVSNIILPTLRKDFLGTLPLELSLHIVRYLDASSMCKAAQVNKQWRDVVDGDGFTWKRCLLSDGFSLDDSEEARAISEDWGFTSSITSPLNRNNYNSIDDDNGCSREVDNSSSEERAIVKIDENDNTEIMRIINVTNGIKSEEEDNDNGDDVNLQDAYTLSPTGTEVQPSSIPNGNNSTNNSDSDNLLRTEETFSIQNKDNTQISDNPYFLRTLQGHNHSVRALAGIGNTLVSGSYDCTVRVWNIMTGESVWRLQGHTQKVYSVVLDAKRKRCMSGSMDGTVKVWSLEDGTNIWTLEGHSSLVGLLDLSHDYLVSAAADSSLRIWNPDNGTCKHVLTTHSGAITCFQHDGDKVISGSDGTLRMWKVKTGKHTRDLLTGLSGVWQVKFDERRCVAAVQRNSVTCFEVLDFGVFGIEEDKNTPNASCTDEDGNWISKRIVVG